MGISFIICICSVILRYEEKFNKYMFSKNMIEFLSLKNWQEKPATTNTIFLRAKIPSNIRISLSFLILKISHVNFFVYM